MTHTKRTKDIPVRRDVRDRARSVLAEDAAAVARRARFGALPERVRPEDTVEELNPAEPDPTKGIQSYDKLFICKIL